MCFTQQIGFKSFPSYRGLNLSPLTELTEVLVLGEKVRRGERSGEVGIEKNRREGKEKEREKEGGGGGERER